MLHLECDGQEVGELARPEPFRGLLEKAFQAEPPPLRVVSVSPAPVLDDEHKARTLESRLDSAILAAGATPPRGLHRPPPRMQEMVPLRLESPFSSKPPAPAPTLNVATKSPPEMRPPPRVLQFLPEQLVLETGRAELTGNTNDSVSSIPRLEPVQNSMNLPVSVGVHTNVYRLHSTEGDDTRPLPAVTLEVLVDAETRKLARNKVVTRDTLDDSGIFLRSFSSDDFADEIDDVDTTAEGFGDPDTDEREGRAPAAIALPALSDEQGLDAVDDDFGDLDDLDELAAQLGLSGVSVPRLVPAPVFDEDDLGEVDADDVELVAVPSLTDPFAALIVRSRLDLEVAADEDAGDKGDKDAGDEDGLDLDGDTMNDVDITGPRRSVSLLPASLFGGLGDDDLTPPRGTPRPAITAPNAVRFVVADAPARPRHESLSDEDRARNKVRARELYLVAMDDLGDGDAAGAVVHLELALAYDDETSLYGDLVEQLKKKLG